MSDEFMSRLLSIRDVLGPYYGSEDLSVLLYAIVRREKPSNVVELGTGLGVSTAWIARALKENNAGSILTVDDGSHFGPLSRSGRLGKVLSTHPALAELAGSANDYEQFLNALFAFCGVEERVKRQPVRFNLIGRKTDEPRYRLTTDVPIDMLFSDFNHSPQTIIAVLREFIPAMADTSSIFVDSASSHLPSYNLLEEFVVAFNRRELPQLLLDSLSVDEQKKLGEFVSGHRFRLIHLYERRLRSQNSTAWIRIEPGLPGPPSGILMH